MPTASSRHIWLLVAVAAALALLVGLVRSGGRETSRPRPSAPIQAWKPAEPASLRMTLLPARVESEAPAPADQRARLPDGKSEARRELARITGIVLRPEGEPASVARVVLGDQHARCSSDGRFELSLGDDRLRASSALLAYEPGYEPALLPAFGASLTTGSEQPLRIVLGPSTQSLAGSVTTRDGRPLAGWTVELDGLDPLADFGLREPVRSDAEGRFLLPDVPAGVHVVRAFEQYRELAFRSPPIAAGEGGLVILAEPSE
jgi:hypothetical protein